MDKLSWMNSQYIKEMDLGKLIERTEEYLKNKGVLDTRFDRAKWKGIIAAYKERTRTLEDLVSVYKIFFSDELEFDQKAVEKYLRKPDSKDIISRCKSAVEACAGYNKASIEEAYRKLADELKIKAAELIHPTRVAISGKTVGAGLFDMMELLGREKVLARLSKFL
jgi:glutamyl-tRNA synthetase